MSFWLEDIKTKEVGIVYEILELEPAQVVETFKSIDDIKDYITDKDMVVEFEKILNDLTKAGINFQPFRGGRRNWIECMYEDEEVAYLQTKQKFIKCQTYDDKEEDWNTPKRIMTYKQWVDECKADILKEIKK